MDIQWIIVARQIKQSAITKNISIIEVIDQFTINEINQPSFDVITKVRCNPTETSETKRITLEISHDKNGELRTIEEMYQVPDLDTLVNRPLQYLLPEFINGAKIGLPKRNLF